jgi:TetR/AcrR family transcriptional regulator
MRSPKVPAKGKRPARRRDGPTTTKQILAAAEKLFARYGFDAVSTNQLAAEAGIAIGALYHHFPSKEAVYAAATKRAFSAKSIPPPEVIQAAGSPERKLAQLIAWFVSAFVSDKTFGLLLKRELLDPRPSTPHLIDKDLFQQPLELCKDLVRQLAPKANVDEAIASMVALLFGFANLKGIHAILPSVRKTLGTPDEIARHVTGLLLRGIQA